MTDHGSRPPRWNISFLLSRPFALLASLGLGAVATLVLWVYLAFARDLNRSVLNLLLFLALALFWYAAWKYLTLARTLRGVRARSATVAKVIAVGAAALGGLWALTLLGIIGAAGTTLQCADCRAISVTRVIDGDTLVSGGTRIRLYGIDAPEVGERCADGATERLKELAGSIVRIESGPRLTDVFDRTLGYLYTEDGSSIDELLVLEGHAVAWTRDGQHREILVDLERTARIEGAGCLW